MPPPPYLLDEQGLVCEFNAAAEQMFGFTKAELLGKPLTPIMPPHLRDMHTAGKQRYLTTGQRHLPHWHNIELPGCSKMAGNLKSLFPAGGW